MRLWSIHPKYLDSKGLVACWREALLAQKVLLGKTKGYKNHSQLDRFKKNIDPIGSIGYYLFQIYSEATRRGYNFDASKIKRINFESIISVTNKQVDYEFSWLQKKLETRDKLKYTINALEDDVEPNLLFFSVNGEIEKWEKYDFKRTTNSKN
jgi:hypothetical protein